MKTPEELGISPAPWKVIEYANRKHIATKAYKDYGEIVRVKLTMEEVSDGK